MRINKTFTFEAAHRLQNHDGKCRNLHGHGYKVEVAVEKTGKAAALQEDGPQEGMLLDFGELSLWWEQPGSGQSFDHITILQDGDPLVAALEDLTPVLTFPWPPTAERMAIYLRGKLQTWLWDQHTGEVLVASVRVWETGKSWAEA